MKKVVLTIKVILTVVLAIILICAISVISFMTAVTVINNNIAKNTAKELVAIPLPEQTEYIESVSMAGKLVGNGNGMQYLGAILIKSEMPLEELKAYYADYADNEWECIVEHQTDKEIKVIVHESLGFQSMISGDDFFIVYSWGSNDNNIFLNLDLRGH